VVLWTIGFNSAEIRWVTDVPTTSVLRYGNQPGSTENSIEIAELKTEHQAVIENLKPGNTYYFQITANDGTEEARYESEFITRGFPVKVTVLDGEQPLENATVDINGQTQQTLEDGTAFFELPSGEMAALVTAGDATREFGFTVQSLTADDQGNEPEEQQFTFVLSAGSGGLAVAILLGLGGVGLLGGGVVLLKRRQSVQRREG